MEIFLTILGIMLFCLLVAYLGLGVASVIFFSIVIIGLIVMIRITRRQSRKMSHEDLIKKEEAKHCSC